MLFNRYRSCMDSGTPMMVVPPISSFALAVVVVTMPVFIAPVAIPTGLKSVIRIVIPTILVSFHRGQSRGC